MRSIKVSVWASGSWGCQHGSQTGLLWQWDVFQRSLTLTKQTSQMIQHTEMLPQTNPGLYIIRLRLCVCTALQMYLRACCPNHHVWCCRMAGRREAHSRSSAVRFVLSSGSEFDPGFPGSREHRHQTLPGELICLTHTDAHTFKPAVWSDETVTIHFDRTTFWDM